MIQLKRFDNPFEANLAKGKLESSGIYSFLKDEHIAINYINQAVGGIKLMVEEQDLERAFHILEHERYTESELKDAFYSQHYNIKKDTTLSEAPTKKKIESKITCPNCSAPNPKKNVFYEFLHTILSILVLSPPPFIKKYNCQKCGNKWTS